MADRQRPADRMASIDALRGFCALIVILYHAVPYRLPLIAGVEPFGRFGRSTLVVFWVASGFFLAMTCEAGAGSVGRLWVRRVSRLFPAYWACLAAAFAIWLVGIPLVSSPPEGLRVSDWLLNLTMCQEFIRRPSVLFVFWTLGYEVAILVAVSLLFALRLQGRTPALIGVMIALFLIGGFTRTLGGQTFGATGARFNYFAPLMGYLAYSFYTGKSGVGPLLGLGVGQAAILFFNWAADAATGRGTRVTEEAVAAACTWAAGYAMFFAALAARRWWMPAALVRLGRVSYAMYLFHILVMSLLMPLRLPMWAYVLALYGGTYLVAEVVSRFVEAPGAELGKAIERRWLPKRPTGGSGAEALPRAA